MARRGKIDHRLLHGSRRARRGDPIVSGGFTTSARYRRHDAKEDQADEQSDKAHGATPSLPPYSVPGSSSLMTAHLDGQMDGVNHALPTRNALPGDVKRHAVVDRRADDGKA